MWSLVVGLPCQTEKSRIQNQRQRKSLIGECGGFTDSSKKAMWPHSNKNQLALRFNCSKPTRNHSAYALQHFGCPLLTLSAHIVDTGQIVQYSSSQQNSTQNARNRTCYVSMFASPLSRMYGCCPTTCTTVIDCWYPSVTLITTTRSLGWREIRH